MEEVRLSLENLGDGAAIERFDLALQEVLNNIQDVNTDAKKARSVTLKVTITPNDDRQIGNLAVDVSAKIVPITAFKTTVFMGKDNSGAGIAVEKGKNQLPLLPDEKGEAEKKVYNLGERKAL
jgi:hypothetical protein